MGQYGMIIYFVVIIAIMYFIMIRPQRKQEKQQQAMINAVRVGDEIITIGGIHGKITKIKDDDITIVTSAQKTSIEISRWAIKDVTKYVEDIKAEKKQENKKLEESKKEEESKKADDSGKLEAEID